jgi:formate-dependent nitrite reductase membrane component NrfD
VSRRDRELAEQRERERSQEIAGKPVETADGRSIDPELGKLAGWAAEAEVERPDRAFPLAPERDELPVAATAATSSPTYYDMPAVKRPVWKPYIPAYFYAGGLAGGAAVLAAAAQLAPRGHELRRLVGRGRFIAAAGCAASAALLIADLGRPARFLNMLRVFRPTSPMNVGTWIISVAGGASGLAALLGGRRGALGRIGEGAGTVAGAAGLPLAGYTAVLLANTAVPLWQGARHTLPFLFVASSAASAAALLEMFPATRREHRVVRLFGVASKTAELVAMAAVTAECASRGPSVARPLIVGTSGRLWKAAAALGAASLGLSLLSGGGRARRAAAGLLGTAAALALRFALAEGGTASTRDPRATFEPQRARRA